MLIIAASGREDVKVSASRFNLKDGYWFFYEESKEEHPDMFNGKVVYVIHSDLVDTIREEDAHGQ